MKRRSTKTKCGDRWRKPVEAITDREKRYRANTPECRPAGPRRCAKCGTSKNVVIHHKDGDESNGKKRNLGWLCRPHNAKAMIAMKRAGKGVRTRQYNPGAKNLGEYVDAAVKHKRGSYDEGGKVIHETPKSTRQKFAREIWSRRRASGRVSSRNGRKPRKKNLFGLFERKAHARPVRRFYDKAADVLKGQPSNRRFKGPRVKHASARNVFWDRMSEGQRRKVAREAGMAPTTADQVAVMTWSALGKSNFKDWKTALSENYRAMVKHGQTIPNPHKADLFIDERPGSTWITPQTARGKRWLRINVSYTSQQIHGRSIVVDSRAASGLANLAESYGLRVSVKNPRKRNQNGDLAGERRMYRKFHGRDGHNVKEIIEVVEYQKDFAKCGALSKMVVKTPNGEFALEFDKRDGIDVATNAEGTQLYLIGGTQDLTRKLPEFGVDTTKDLVKIGVCTRIDYITQKRFDKFKTTIYWHKLGEETGKPPDLIFDQLNKRMAFVGGEYVVRPEGIVN